MSIEATGGWNGVVRVAAGADLHCSEANRSEIEAALAGLDGRVDLVLIAGDVTTHGEPEQAAVLADACRGVSTPIVAVLGNHDWHAARHGEIAALLREAGVTVLDRAATVCRVAGTEVGVVGTKGFVGGFPPNELPDWGEPLLREVYAEGGAEADAIGRGLDQIARCPIRVVVLHYSPVADTLEGERREIWAFLGSHRMAAPIARHRPELVVHGHAHAGSAEGEIAGIPVYNVAAPVIGDYFRVFELSPADRALS